MLVDIGGTLVDKMGPGGNYIEGIPALFKFLRSAEIVPILVSNDLTQQSLEAFIAQNPPLRASMALTRETVGIAKGSPRWIDMACERLGVKTNELLYVGDSKWDMITASQRGVVYFHAGWAAAHDRYGVNVESPNQLRLILKDIFLKDDSNLWYWSLDAVDDDGRPVVARALIDGNGANLKSLKTLLMSLKSGQDSVLGTMKFRRFLILHLLAALYLEGLTKEITLWCTYPGSSGKLNLLVDELLDTAARLIRAQLKLGLISRHSPVPASHTLRIQRLPAPFSLQTDSILLHADSKLRQKIEGKTVAVFDDFITRGNAAEAARNFLMQLGAAKIVSIGIGKYGADYDVQTPTCPPWNARKAAKGLSFKTHSMSSPTNTSALGAFRDAYDEFRQIQ